MTEIYDSHIHSCFSADGEVPPEKIILHAVSRGIKGICFTDHMDPDFGQHGQEFTFDPDLYFDTLLPLAASYAADINISIGMEFGMQPHLLPVFEHLTDNYPFDFVIGSQHLVYGEDPYDRTVFGTYSGEEVVRRYYTEMLENLRLFKAVNTLGHPEYIFRYVPHHGGMTFSRFEDAILPVIAQLIANGTGLEINTASSKQAAAVRDEIAAAYAAAGGTVFTAGSDAHLTDAIGSGFEKVYTVIQENGAGHYTFFTKGEPHYINI